MVVLRAQCLVITDLDSNHRSITYWLWNLREVIFSQPYFSHFEDIYSLMSKSLVRIRRKSFFFFATLSGLQALQFHSQGSNLHPLHWKYRILINGPREKSRRKFLDIFSVTHGPKQYINIWQINEWMSKHKSYDKCFDNAPEIKILF